MSANATMAFIGNSGFMIGPPLIGRIAAAISWTAALAVVVLAAGLLAFGARYLPVKPD